MVPASVASIASGLGDECQTKKRNVHIGTKRRSCAAEAAVLVDIAERAGRMDRGFDELTSFGIKKSFFKSAIGDNVGI